MVCNVAQCRSIQSAPPTPKALTVRRIVGNLDSSKPAPGARDSLRWPKGKSSTVEREGNSVRRPQECAAIWQRAWWQLTLAVDGGRAREPGEDVGLYR